MTDTSLEEIAHLKEVIAILTERLNEREKQLAFYGPAVEPHIVLDKKRVQKELAKARADLRRAQQTRPDEHSPYLGLLTFQESDVYRFFGREEMVEDLVAKVRNRSFLAVLGPSGSGKSSVVHAGLVAALREGALPGSTEWCYLSLRPTERPLHSLHDAMDEAELGDIYAKFAEGEGRDWALVRVADVLRRRQKDTRLRLVLVVDQGEELWIPPDKREQLAIFDAQRSVFIQLLLTAINAANNSVLIILTMRTDFLDRATKHSELGPAIADHDVIVSPMNEDELRDAIERPAQIAGGSFEPGLVDELVKQTGGRGGMLPLLEYTLQELWKAKQPEGVLTWASYHELGKLEGALTRRADAILNDRYTDSERDELRHILLRLVQPGAGMPDTRRRARLVELVPARGSETHVQDLLRPLVDERLIITGQDEATSAATVELAHEALIHDWKTLKTWIDMEPENLRRHADLRKAASDWLTAKENVRNLSNRKLNADAPQREGALASAPWHRYSIVSRYYRSRFSKVLGLISRYYKMRFSKVLSNRKSDYLWSGQRLADAEAWLEQAGPQLSNDEIKFLDACRAHNNDLVQSRYWGQAAGGAVGAALGYGLAFAIGHWFTSSDLSIEDHRANTVTTFLVMFPVGTLAGLSIGIGLLLCWKIGRPLAADASQRSYPWIHRLKANPWAYRIPITGLLGALTGSIAYTLFIAEVLDPVIRPEYIATGLLLGAGLGIGAGFAVDKERRLLATTLGGLVGLVLAVLVGGLLWSLPVTLLAGLVLGLATGVGFWRTAVENGEVEEAGDGGAE